MESGRRESTSVRAGWHGAAAPHSSGRLSPGCRPQSQVSMMEWCTDVDVSSSSFLSLSLGSSFFWAPKQSVQSSEISAPSAEIYILTLPSLPLPKTPPSGTQHVVKQTAEQGTSMKARRTWVSRFFSIKCYLLIFYHLIPHLAQPLRRERPLQPTEKNYS